MPEEAREAFASEIAGDWRKPVHEKMTDLFTSPATHVIIFFADLISWEAFYNRPGVIHPDNWPLREPPDFADPYPASAACGEALNIPTVLALALRARGTEFTAAHRDLIDQPLRMCGWWERHMLIRV